MSQLRVAIHGAAGRMGQRLVACVHHDTELQLVAALDSPKCSRLGEDAGEVAGCGKTGILIASELSSPVDVVIDFSVPEATELLIPMCVARKLPLVVATTGFNEAQKAAVQRAAEQIPLVWSPSMSVAVNLLMKLVRDAARVLKDNPKKEGLVIHPRTIGKILKKEGLVRKYRVRKITYKYIRAERKPGELVEIDVKYVPGTIANKAYFQYTAIDTASRWRHLKVFPEQSSSNSITFLEIVIGIFEHTIQGIKTDNHAIFTNLYTGTNKRSDLTVKTLIHSICFVQHTISFTI